MKLTKLLSDLTNERVRVELKNGTIIQGSLSNVSPSMNLTLKKASMTLKHRDPVNVEFVNIRGSNIRGIVLPETLNLDIALQSTPVTRKRKADDDKSTTKRARAL